MRATALTARVRLTILYATLVLVAGVALVGLVVVLMRQSSVRRRTLVLVDTDGNVSSIAQQVRDATVTEVVTQAAIALGVVTLLTALLGWCVAGRVLRPIRTIADTAQRLSAENLSERVPHTTPADELTALADTINGMLDRIQHGVAERDQVLASQRMFTANVAHELRTPLTTVRTAIDVTLDGAPDRAELLTMAGDIRTAIEHSQRTVDGLLLLATSQAGLGERELHLVDLADIATDLLDSSADRLAARDLALRTNPTPALVCGEPVLLERLIGNLVDNAIRYNHDGGHVTVSTGTRDGRAYLRIVNTGRRIEPAEADRLPEPFVHGTRHRTRDDGGAGLGLSIVRAIALAHDGRLSTVANPHGGLDITVDLPEAEHRPAVGGRRSSSSSSSAVSQPSRCPNPSAVRPDPQGLACR